MGTSILRAIMKKLTAKVGNLLGHTVLMRGEEPACASGLDRRLPDKSRIEESSIVQGCPNRADINNSNFVYCGIVSICQGARAQEQAQTEAYYRNYPRFVRRSFACCPAHAIHRLIDWLDRILSLFLPPHLIFLRLPLAKLSTVDLAEEVVPILLSRLLMPVRESTSG